MVAVFVAAVVLLLIVGEQTSYNTRSCHRQSRSNKSHTMNFMMDR